MIEPSRKGEGASTLSHKAGAPKSVGFAILVISTSVSKGEKEDRSGALIRSKVLAAGHRVVAERVVSDDADAIREAVLAFARDPTVAAIVSTGGTGLTLTDITVETVRPLFSKEITGFTPLFIALSYEDVGAAAVLSRATAGIIEGNSVLFALPGSPKACELAMDKIILPEVAHITKHFKEA